jgi:hypothetical protein
MVRLPVHPHPKREREPANHHWRAGHYDSTTARVAGRALVMAVLLFAIKRASGEALLSDYIDVSISLTLYKAYRITINNFLHTCTLVYSDRLEEQNRPQPPP